MNEMPKRLWRRLRSIPTDPRGMSVLCMRLHVERILGGVTNDSKLNLRRFYNGSKTIAAMLFSFTTLLSAQTPTLTTQSTLILVPATIQGKDGAILYGLRPDQFVLEDNGLRRQVQVEEDPAVLGLSLAIVIQCSRDAYRDFPHLHTLATIVEAVIGGGDSQRPVAVVRYGTEPELVGDFTSEPAELKDTLDHLTPCRDDDQAATLDAVAYAAGLLDARKDHTRHAILLISETRDHGSIIQPEAAIAALGRTNTVVDAVSFTPAKTQLLSELRHGSYGPTNYIPLMVMAVNALRSNVPHELAALSGGEYTNFTTQKGFDQALHQLSNHIRNYYLLSFQPPSATAPGLHQLTLHVPDHPTAQIRTRESYYVPDPQK